jgi:hypothetical protein
MAVLSDFDRNVVRVLRGTQVLENEDARKVPMDNGVIVIPCSDGDQLPDLFGHDCELAFDNGGIVRPHMPALHGGAMLIAEDCPLYRKFRVDELLLVHIQQAEAMKEIHTVILYIHTPCGAAGLAGLNLIQQIMFLMRAKVRVKKIDPTNKVICKVHVDYGPSFPNDKRRRTYFISLSKWEEYCLSEDARQWGDYLQPEISLTDISILDEMSHR